jgi:hypothetical protein
MQEEIDTEGWSTETRLIGINQIGAESGNETICNGRSIPWLQDTAAQQVWQKWEVVYRDVVILDAENKRLAVFNLTIYDLAESANYDSLKSLLRSFAQ